MKTYVNGDTMSKVLKNDTVFIHANNIYKIDYEILRSIGLGKHIVYIFFAYKDSPVVIIPVSVRAPSAIIAYITLIDNGYTLHDGDVSQPFIFDNC
jgi:hypothetical protein